MAQWINLNQNNRSLLAHQYSVLGEKLAHPPTASGSYGREAGQQMKCGWVLHFKKFSAG